jgi:hypothetical protein
MKKIKMFTGCLNQVEKDINEYLTLNNYELIDIKDLYNEETYVICLIYK